jgi:hypothetical protein
MTYLTPTHIKKYSSLEYGLYQLDFELEDLQNKRKKISACVGVDYVTPSQVDTPSGSVQCKRGVDYILTHLEKPLFPRDIMTKKLGHKIEVFDKESILWHFEGSNYQDCRISAYPRLTQYKEINLVPPSLVMIDLDLSVLGTELVLNKALKTTLNRIYKTLQTRPTVFWTGNGYHIYLPIKAFILEEEEVFANFQNCKSNGPSLSTKFIRFAEAFFTNKKHDPQHRPSVNSCLLRVPGSYNSKNGQQVSVIQRWDGKKPAIQYMLRNFRRHLIQEKLDEVNDRNKKKLKPSNNTSFHTILWIESLLHTPIHDHRKYCLWRILVPYFVNVRKLSDMDAYVGIMLWLELCNKLKRLSFDPKHIARYDIQSAKRIGYLPISSKDLKLENKKLHELLNGKELQE